MKKNQNWYEFGFHILNNLQNIIVFYELPVKTLNFNYHIINF